MFFVPRFSIVMPRMGKQQQVGTEKTMPFRDNQAIFCTFWGDFLTKLDKDRRQIQKLHRKIPKLQSSVACRGRLKVFFGAFQSPNQLRKVRRKRGHRQVCHLESTLSFPVQKAVAISGMPWRDPEEYSRKITGKVLEFFPESPGDHNHQEFPKKHCNTNHYCNTNGRCTAIQMGGVLIVFPFL